LDRVLEGVLALVGLDVRDLALVDVLHELRPRVRGFATRAAADHPLGEERQDDHNEDRERCTLEKSAHSDASYLPAVTGWNDTTGYLPSMCAPAVTRG